MDNKAIVKEMQDKMDKALQHAVHEFGNLHTGKANPAMVEDLQITVEAYGTTMRIRDMAAVTTPDARMIQITPWDKGALKDIEKGIRAANIGFNPAVHGNTVRCIVPELSGERRQELVKVAHRMAEEARIALRAARHHALDVLKKQQKTLNTSEDEMKRLEKDIQTAIDKKNDEVNKLLSAKEKDLLTV
ncbi:MAG: ribosome recycling factor [Verrucomicrobiota bacterium]|nr:ribosome recycling factor [Verrucomicrobiota bacterium]